jgi:predicted regulator of Ras-like GTPase activity (Roadblock/LC7/MglB family)
VPFHYILTNLLVDIPGAQGAIFLDYEGEAVEFVSRQATPYELKLEGAYQGIFLRRLGRLTQLLGGGEIELLWISGQHMQVMGQVLKGGYYLLVIASPGTPLSVASHALRRTTEALNREIP